MAITHQTTDPMPGDSQVVLLQKLLQLFGGSPTSGDGTPQLLRDILAAAAAGGGGSGTETAETLTYAASVALDFDEDAYKILDLAGDVTFTTANLGAVKSVVVKITADGIDRSFTFPGDWTFLTNAPPANIAAGKVAILSLTAFGSTDADVIASYAVEP